MPDSKGNNATGGSANRASGRTSKRKLRSRIARRADGAAYGFRQFIFRHHFALVRARLIAESVLVFALGILGCFAIVWLNANYQMSIPAKELVVSQIAVVSITTSIVALIAGFGTRTIYGFHLSEAVFRRPMADTALLFIPIALTVINLLALVTKESNPLGLDVDGLILFVFFLAYYFVFIFVGKIASAVIRPKAFDDAVQLLYLDENVKQMKKDRPLKAAQSKSLSQLQDVTFKYIDERSTLANENIRAELRLAEALLLTKRELYQNYLIEMSNYNDPLTHVASYSEEMLFRMRLIPGIKDLVSVYSMLNYYEVVNISNYALVTPARRAAERARFVEDIQTAESYQAQILWVDKAIWVQKDLFLKTDFSGYRLFDNGLMFPACFPETLLADYYHALMSNQYLSADDKDRLMCQLYDDLRMSQSPLNNPLTARSVRDNKASARWSADRLKRTFQNRVITMQSSALLALAVAENGCVLHFKMLASMNLDHPHYCTMWIQCLAALVDHMLADCRSQYLHGLKMDEESSRAFALIIDHRRIAEDADILRLLHDELHKCVDDAFGSGTKESQAYGFNPKLCYDGDVLDGVIGFLARASESASGNDLEKDLAKSKTSKAARDLLQKLF